MGGLVDDPKAKGLKDANTLTAQMKALHMESVRSSARLAGLSSGKVTQTRARPVSGGLAGGQAQRTGGIQGGKIGGPLGKRGPAGSTTGE